MRNYCLALLSRSFKKRDKETLIKSLKKNKNNQSSLSLLYNNNEQFNRLSYVLKVMTREALVEIELFLSKDC